MTLKTAHLVTRVAEKLKTISAHDLQVLSEELALIKFPSRFRDSGTFHRRGRNPENQTTKGWPDAYVQTGDKVVDGVEATREKLTWHGHLNEDLGKAVDGENFGLSGYFFVGGYPTAKASPTQIADFESKFANLGISRDKVTILVGNDLVLELVRPEYARILNDVLNIPPSPEYFCFLIPGLLAGEKLAEFQPSRDDFKSGIVKRPALLENVVQDLLLNGIGLVRGHGACGKTTLAQLISVHEKISPAPVYYVDFAKVDVSEVAGSLKNEMMAFSGKSVLFVVDNIHLDENFAEYLYEFWRDYLKGAEVRVLFLGRERASKAGTPLGGLRAHVLRAGRAELKGVVERIFSRHGIPLPVISARQLNDWVKTFGGKASAKEVTVDLVAFSAAVQFRIENMRRGVYKLTANDAVAAIREKYLRPIPTKEERENLLRLAALSDFEIALPLEALAHQEHDFPVANKEMGLVLCNTSSGRDPRRIYTLAHAALGGLILAAAGKDFELADERKKVARKFPVIGMRMISRFSVSEANSEIESEVKISLQDGSWVKSCSTIDEWATLLRAARTKKLLSGIDLSPGLAVAMKERILNGPCNIPALYRFVAEAKHLGLTETIEVIYNSPDQGVFSALEEVICSARPDEISMFLRQYGNPQKFIVKIDASKWNIAQGLLSLYYFAEAIAALRDFEKWGRIDLVQVPAARILRERDESLLRNFNIGILAHLFRMSNVSVLEKKNFLDWMREIGELKRIFDISKRTHLSGVFISFANHLDSNLKPYFLDQLLVERVLSEIKEGWVDDAENSKLKNSKKKIFTVSLLGAFVNFGGNIPDSFSLMWPKEVNIDDLLATGLLDLKEERIGLYQLLFWLGLREYSRRGVGPTKVPAGLAEKFKSRLENSPAPTESAKSTKKLLLQWLECCKLNDWELCK